MRRFRAGDTYLVPAPEPAAGAALGYARVSTAELRGGWEWTFGQRWQPVDLLVDFNPSAALPWNGSGR